MRLGLIARADRSGLGVQCHEFYRAMQPERVLIIDVGHLHNNTSHCNKATDVRKYANPIVFKGWDPDTATLKRFMTGLDVVFSCETFYSDQFPDVARQLGVRTVLQPNFEFLRPHVAPDLWAAPSLWRFDEIPDPKVFLPVPIATDRFGEPSVASGAPHFLHIVGRPAIHDRNGTPDVLAALQHVRSNITVTLKCQDMNYLHQLSVNVPPNVELVLDGGDVENYWQNYDADVLLMPRRFGGLCLPINEALGAGMPVIATDIEPNNTWLPGDWLVPARKTAEFMAFQRVDVYTADHEALAAKIDQFATDFYTKAKADALRLRDEYSWPNLKPMYQKVLSEL